MGILWIYCLVIKTTKGKTYANIDIGSLNPIFRFKIVALTLNWVFQGLLYADKTEKAFKIALDLALTSLVFISITDFSFIVRLLVAFLISHTFFWVFNGQLFALLKNFNLVHNTPQRIIDYAGEIKCRASKEASINCVAIYGSISRGEISSTSDLDMRIIRKPGMLNGMRACFFGFAERSRALLNMFPLDLYIIDSKEHLFRLRNDELPLILYDPQGILKSWSRGVNV